MICLGFTGNVLGQVGVTDDCQQDIQELEDEMDRDRDDYTAESRRKAQAQVAAAKTNRLNPAKCRKNLADARQELRQGERDKRND
jgi:hypothetical protein